MRVGEGRRRPLLFLSLLSVGLSLGFPLCRLSRGDRTAGGAASIAGGECNLSSIYPECGRDSALPHRGPLK